MAAHEAQGLPDVPDVPSTPIFPSHEIDRRPRPPGHDLVATRHEPTVEEDDRLELSKEGRAFNAAREIFERIEHEFASRMAEGEPQLRSVDRAALEVEMIAGGEVPEAAADLILRELQRETAMNFERREGLNTGSFEAFKRRAREAFDAALEDARVHLSESGQLDAETEGRLDATKQRLSEGVEALLPF